MIAIIRRSHKSMLRVWVTNKQVGKFSVKAMQLYDAQQDSLWELKHA